MEGFSPAPIKLIALNVAAHRLENLIHDRRLLLASAQGAPPEPVQG
ncbi:hypothetical protein [Bradyrhizobium sp. McL0615]